LKCDAGSARPVRPEGEQSYANNGLIYKPREPDIEARVKKIIAEQLGVEEGLFTSEKAAADLGADSLDTGWSYRGTQRRV
jgi:hypothetical protein